MIRKLTKEDSSNPTQADYDMIYGTKEKLKKLSIQVILIWTEGHQDNNKQFKDLNAMAQMNIFCGSLAKIH